MVSFATATFSFKQLLPVSSVITYPSRPTCSSSNSKLGLRTGIDTRRTSSDLSAAEYRRNLRTVFVVKSDRRSSSLSNQASLEDPGDGSGSEYDDEEDEGVEGNLDFESDWEQGEEERVSSATAAYGADKPSTTTYKCEEDLLKEVEQLLGPDERDVLQQNASPNLGKISTAKWNPLHSLALAGQIHYVDMLLENGTQIDLVDNNALTALHTAIVGKKEAVISHLLRKGANPNVRDRDGASPLHYAVQVGALQTVKLLIKYNVDLNAADYEGWTPLHIAMQSRNRDIAKVLLVNGADRTRRNKDGKTPLDLALCYGKDFKSYDLAKLLKTVPANRDTWKAACGS